MMKEARFKYRCRFCGTTYTSSITGEKNALMSLIATINDLDTHKFLIGVRPSLIEIHTCDKNRTGVSDLIGYELK